MCVRLLSSAALRWPIRVSLFSHVRPSGVPCDCLVIAQGPPAALPSRFVARCTLTPPVTRPSPPAALAKWLENKRLREERLAQRRQYGAIRLNPVLVSNVEVHAPEPSEAERDAHSVRGSGSFDLGLPALVGVGVGGGGMGQHGLSAAPPPYLKGANPEPNPTPA